MKGNIFDVKRLSVHDGPGIRTTVFLKGCPLTCPWCHNPEGMSAIPELMFYESKCIGKTQCKNSACMGKEELMDLKGTAFEALGNGSPVCPSAAIKQSGREISIHALMEEILRDEVYYNVSGGGVTVSGGEPAMQPDFLIALLKAAKEKGIHTTLDTSAYIEPSVLESLLPLVDLFLIDIKVADESEHRRICGVDNSSIKRNIEWLCSQSANIILRFPLIPGYTDNEENTRGIIEFVSSLNPKPRLEILPYHSFAAAKYERLGIPYQLEGVSPISSGKTEGIKARFIASGIDTIVQDYREKSKKTNLGKRNQTLLKRALAMKDNRIPWDCSLWFTRGFREMDEDASVAIKRANALKKMAENMDISIKPDELIVGEQLRTVPWFGGGEGHDIAWIKGIVAPETRLDIDTAHVPPDIADELSWWKGRNLESKISAGIDMETFSLLSSEGVIDGPKKFYGHTVPSFETALSKGFAKIKQEAEEKIRSLQPNNEASKEKETFYRSVILCCEAIIGYGKRYAQEAMKAAKQETDLTRREELLNIAAVCAAVPENAPKTFQEALQMTWFVHFFNEEECPHSRNQSFGRIDQYLYPYYKNDIDEGRITREYALELMEGFWIKCYRTFEEQHTMIGGITENGEEGVNDLTYICLDALENVVLPRALGVRITKDSPKEYLQKIIETLEYGMGVPSIYNDDVIIAALKNKGMREEHAINYSVTGCVELAVPGVADFLTVATNINLAKVLEMALNDGCSLLTGQRIGQPTGGPDRIKTFDELSSICKTHLSYVIEKACALEYNVEKLMAKHQPMPFLSSLMEPCMESGADVIAGGAAYNYSGMCAVEVATFVNAMAAIKKAVFEEGRLTLPKLTEILKNNFEGFEDVHQYLMHHVPKFGNDDPYVDAIAKDIMHYYAAELAKQPHARGGSFIPLLFSRPVTQRFFGSKTAATADGRKAKEMTAVSLNPVNGTVSKGLTAIFNSQNRIDLTEITGGVSNNLDIHPSLLIGEGREKLEALLRGWCASGGMEVALQICDSKMLKEAQKDPEKYADLSVRVYGYSEFFKYLDKQTQDYIIARSEL